MRDTNELKKAIKTAEEAVEDMHDPILKTAAFQTILKELLPKQKEETNQSEQKFSSFSQGNVNVNQTMPLEVFQTTSDGFKIIANFGKDVGKSKQIQYVLLYLYANKLQTGQRVCLSKIVQKAMKTCGFGELPNLNAYLRAVPNLVIVAVKKEKAKNTYELTDIGLNVASQLINEIKESGGAVKETPKTLTEYLKGMRKRGNMYECIDKLIADGFFDEPQIIKSLKKKLEELNVYAQRSVIDACVRQSFLGKKLTRVKITGKWAYVRKNK